MGTLIIGQFGDNRSHRTDDATEPGDFVAILRRHYQSIQRLEGDDRLRVTISAEREATRGDPQMSRANKELMYQALDQLEAELLTNPNSNGSPDPRAPQ